ncbi:MAG: hypothetical protein KTR30_32165 [Saprospiraceae bacterium]|nr:hypothetical protein [Saprospiraceae bacterium]
MSKIIRFGAMLAFTLCLLAACGKTNFEEIKVTEEEVPVEVEEIDPGQVLITVREGNDVTGVLFDSTAFVARDLGNQIRWTLSGDFGDRPDYYFFLDFYTNNMDIGLSTYPVTDFRLTDDGITTHYQGNEVEIDITITDIDEGNNTLTGLLQGRLISGTNVKTVSGQFLQAPVF